MPRVEWNRKGTAMQGKAEKSIETEKHRIDLIRNRKAQNRVQKNENEERNT